MQGQQNASCDCSVWLAVVGPKEKCATCSGSCSARSSGLLRVRPLRKNWTQPCDRLPRSKRRNSTPSFGLNKSNRNVRLLPPHPLRRRLKRSLGLVGASDHGTRTVSHI